MRMPAAMRSAVFVFPASQSDAASTESRSVVSGVESSISTSSSSISDSTDIAQRSAVVVCTIGKTLLLAPLVALLVLLPLSTSGFTLLPVEGLDEKPPSPPRRLVFELPLSLDGLAREPTEDRDFLELLESDCSLGALDLRLRDLELDRLDLGRDDDRDLARRPRERLRDRLRDFGRRVPSYRETPSMSRSFLTKGLLSTLFISAPGFAKPIIANARSVAR